MALPESVIKQLRPEITVPFGEGIKVTIRRLPATEFRAVEGKIVGMDTDSEKGDAVVAAFRDALQFGICKINGIDVELDADDVLTLWQNAGPGVGIAVGSQAMRYWGILPEDEGDEDDDEQESPASPLPS